MVSQVVRIIAVGVWAALTGGWYYDPEQSAFNNNCHLYLWIFLMILPLALHLGLRSSTVALCIYCGSVTLFFILTKLISYHLHFMIDEEKIVQGKIIRWTGKEPHEKEEVGTVIPALPTLLSNNTEEAYPSPELKRPDILHEDCRWHMLNSHHSTSAAELQNPNTKKSPCASSQQNITKKEFYKCVIFPGKWVEVCYNRHTLLALLDRTDDVKESTLAVLLAVLVSLFGFLVLNQGFCRNIWIFQFCFVMASCHYSLIKSVQPDPASPVHGYNQIITYSRPVYFCISCILILVLDAGSKWTYFPEFNVYGLQFFSSASLTSAREQMILFVYCFPAISLLGLFPQIDTFFVYLLEQMDILLFGGSATAGASSALYSVSRSTFTVIVLHLVGFSALKEPWDEQQIPALFSAFCGLLVTLSYLLSRQSSDPSVILSLIHHEVFPHFFHQTSEEPLTDYMDSSNNKQKASVKEVLKSDLINGIVAAVISFAVSASTVFLSLRPFLSFVLVLLAGTIGFVAHYILPQLRKHHPWLCISHPILQNKETHQREVTDTAHIMWFEKLYVWLQCFEKNILYPAIVLNAITIDALSISKSKRLGIRCDAILMTVAGMKLLRLSFCNPGHQFVTLGFTILFFQFDYSSVSESLLLDFFIMTIVVNKVWDLLHKLQFVWTYIAPWQLAWGSSFHVFAQFFAIPHTAMLFFQAFITSIFSAPLSPFLGSVIFIASYARPIKFWEKDYNTKRADHSNICLKDPGNDDSKLNSIYYEHLATVLQESLCGDLILGRWGNYSSGDCFILTSENLNCLVHLIETGNGFVVFQLRGLEFKGTYCQQREVEAITEGYEDDDMCCCYRIGHLPYILSHNAAFNIRWLTWEVIQTCYTLEGYSIIHNNVATMLQVFDLRKALIKYYIKSIIYFTTMSPKLLDWLQNESIQNDLQPYTKWHYIENDEKLFNINIDEDFIPCLQGITRASFCSIYLDWIIHCARKSKKPVESDDDSSLVTLSFALSIVGRKVLRGASYCTTMSLNSFLYGLHCLFKGDFQLTASDEWVFADMDLLHTVVAPAIRMSLKLFQNQFTGLEEYEDCDILYGSIESFEKNIVICEEDDPAWRSAVLSNKDELLTLRHVVNEGVDEYKMIMLLRSYLQFKVVKVNKESVRGLWAGQQQELIFLRNHNPERGSIQNNIQVLRNLINSSCDQPLGYPIYVSPLIASYVGAHVQMRNIWGRPIRLDNIKMWFKTKWLRMRKECDTNYNSGDNTEDVECEVSCSSDSSTNSARQMSHSHQMIDKNPHPKMSSQQDHPYTGRRKCRSQSVQTHACFHEILPASSTSETIVDNQQQQARISASAHAILQMCSSNRLNSSLVSIHPQVLMVTFASESNMKEPSGTMNRSRQGSSTNSTLSLLFGKISFSSALVISGLSAADGGNTTDTHSSSSVNITNMAIGPSARREMNTAMHPVETYEFSDATESDQLKDKSSTEAIFDIDVVENIQIHVGQEEDDKNL